MSKFLSSFLGWPSAEKDDLTQPQLNEDATLGRGDVEGVVSQLETQMTSSPVMVQLPPPDLPQPRSFNSAYEAAALAVSAPTTGLSIHRLRSLSKAFTALPAKPLPTYPQMAMDQVEYLMHVLLLETNPARAYKHQRNIEAAFSTFVNCDPSAKDCLTSGRLYSRTQVTALACDIIVLRLDDDVVTPDCDDDIPLASNLSSDHWNSIQEQIIFVKGILLRQNANAVVTWESGGAIPAPVPDSDLPDDQLAKHLMMTVDYEEVVRLLSVQQELASLREQLLATADLENQSESSNTNLTGKSPHNYERIVNKAVEKAVNQYMENLSRIFPPVDISTEEDDEIDDGFVLDEGSDTDSMPATRISNVPQELNSFVLTDLYRSKQQRQRTTATDMVNRLLKHVQSITTDTKTPALTQSGIFSYANLQQKMRALLIQWSESILDIPTLVRLGYGGVPSPFVDRDIDDISSWGGDNDDDDLEVEDNPGRRQISARSKLITRILNAVMRGQSVSLTEEEKDIIAQLSVTETAIRPSPQSRSNPGVEASASGDFRERLLNTEKNAVSIPEMSLDALSDLRKDPPPQRESDRISHRQKTQKDPTLGMQRKGTTKSLIIKAQHNPKTCNQPSDSDSSDKEARRVVKVSRRLLARQLNESESDCEAKAHQAPKNTALGPDSDSGSRGGVRRVVKASRRLMAKAPYESESELESRKPAAKRKRYEKTGRDESGDDDSSLDAPVMKLSRRIRNWASSERQSKRMRTTPTEEEDSLKENNQPMNTGETSKESATRLQWSGSEGETTPIHRQKESTAYSPTKRYAFTEEETAAIRDGVFRFGVGHWKTIQENDARLRHRTNEQVKDKFRTMKNRGEI